MTLNTGIVKLSGSGPQELLPANPSRSNVLINSPDSPSYVGCSGFTSGFKLEENVTTYFSDTDSIWIVGSSGNRFFFAEETGTGNQSPTNPIVQQFGPGNWTWQKPDGISYVRVIVVGGGGGGGAGAYTASVPSLIAAGGAGAGWNTATYSASSLQPTECIIVGSGGPGGVFQNLIAVDGLPGLNGGDTTFGSSVSLLAGGGQGGSGSIVSGGTPFQPLGGSGSIVGGTGGYNNFGPGGNGAAGGGAAGSFAISGGLILSGPFPGGNGIVSGSVVPGGQSGLGGGSSVNISNSYLLTNVCGGGGAGSPALTGPSATTGSGGPFGGGGAGGISVSSGLPAGPLTGANGANGVCLVICY